jgi:hypothetical protein
MSSHLFFKCLSAAPHQQVYSSIAAMFPGHAMLTDDLEGLETAAANEERECHLEGQVLTLSRNAWSPT